MMRDHFLTLNGAFFSTVTPATSPISQFIPRATPGPAISLVIKECIVPRALVVHSAPKLEWEDALLSCGRLALRSGPHLGRQGEEEDDGGEVGEGEELSGEEDRHG